MIGKFLPVALALPLLGGCATITRGASEDVRFVSDPPGAAVTTTTGAGCTTPCEISIARRETFTATFRMEGREERVFVDTVVAGGGAAGVAGNLLFGGLIGIGVDAATGAALDHVPNPVRVAFAGLRPPVVPEAPGPAAASGPGGPAGPVAEAVPAPQDRPRDGGPALTEGAPLDAFTADQLAAYCRQDWEMRVAADGRTEYNPCRMPTAFR
ncbi:hypothetical protein LNKW23_46650 [Paralimibaculum aggregatum]|uniref:Translation initiation factor 2 n=1 Tax=Paralimibaculum aggregatum TaxID=3036245 RepID=A0ABQ6LTM1_9RHOB|nr:hypothetical protein [Limibaculum sp. NKW23]GMG85445.1 hypothetical protein LNKW23_46650 [Limibaculum sp. NKW23]